MTLKERIKKLENKIQKEIWALQMLDYATPIASLRVTDNLAIMQKELKELKNKL